MPRQHDVGAQPQHGAGKGGPRYARFTEGRKPEPAEAEAEVAHHVGQRHEEERDKGQHHLLMCTENGIHHDEHVIERELTAVRHEKGGQCGTQFRRDLQGVENERSAEERQQRDERSGGRGKHDDEPRVAIGPAAQSCPEGLTHGCHASAADERSEKHEHGEKLSHHTDGGLNRHVKPARRPHVCHADDKVAKHKTHLRQSEQKDFFCGRKGVILFGGGHGVLLFKGCALK